VIDVSIRGHLKLAEQLRFLALSPADKRRVHGWLARELERAMRRAVRETVLESSLEHFEGDERLRRRKARSFAAMVGRRATADQAVLFDKGHGHRFARKKTTGATEAQAERLRELGFTLSKRYIMRRFTPELAGYLVRKIETAKGVERKRRQRSANGSLILLVWRERGEELLAMVDPVDIFRRFVRARLRATRGQARLNAA
jgi:hypothetical protein